MILVEADASHIPALAANMREADRIEIGAMGRTPQTALRNGLAASVWALTALVDDEPQAIMGVAPVSVMEGFGVPWMLGSERIYDHARDLVRYGPGIIAEMRQSFERLENMVHVDNTRALRFLRHFGFTISGERETIGGIDFVRFSNVV